MFVYLYAEIYISSIPPNVIHYVYSFKSMAPSCSIDTVRLGKLA